ncbi:MAG TPA: DUF1579 family protein [Planctomycetota bacterium]
MRLLLALSLFSTIAAGAVAQEATIQPAPELAKFAPVIGHFEGSGTVVPAPGIPPMQWTATSVTKKILNGHFIQEDLHVEFGDVMPAMDMRTLYGWDAEKERIGAFTVSNSGPATVVDAHWAGDGVLIGSTNAMEDGQPVVDRWVSTYTKAGATFKIHRTMGAEAPFLHVEGTMKRVAGGATAKSAGKVLGGLVAQPPAMAKLAKIAGEYDVKGTMVMEPGTPAMNIYGTETATVEFGGNVLQFRVVGGMEGTPADYEAISYVTWDPTDKCYRHFSASNMGEYGVMDMRWSGDGALVSNHATSMQGQPVSMRSILKIDPAKGIVASSNDMMLGDMPATTTFNATYTRKMGKKQ